VVCRFLSSCSLIPYQQSAMDGGKELFQDLGEGGEEAFDSALKTLASGGSLVVESKGLKSCSESNPSSSVLKPIHQLIAETVFPTFCELTEEASRMINKLKFRSTLKGGKKKSISLSVFLGLEKVRDEVLPTPYACEKCGKRFELQWDLHVHLKMIHSIEPYHACDQCTRVYTRLEDFERHRITHGKRRHKCCVCEMTFLRQETLECHIRNYHNLAEEITSNLHNN